MTGLIADNLRHFCQSLRAVGVAVGPDQVADALSATAQAGIHRQDDAYVALRTVLVKHPGHFALFDQLFGLYFRHSGLLHRPETSLPAAAAAARCPDSRGRPGGGDAGRAARERDMAGTASDVESLRYKDFEYLSDEEQRAVQQAIRERLPPLRPVVSRRLVPHRQGGRVDSRRTSRRMLGNGGDPVEFAWLRKRRRPPDVVLLCDISGSMSSYARVFLLFAHALAARQRNVAAFVFGTRLTAVTRHLRAPDADRMLRRIAAEVVDWDGGTRIAACIGQFNRAWGRRVLAGNATVVLLTDGLERGAAADLAFQTERLRRSCRELLWLNPLLRYGGFAPRAAGIRHMLPHVDRHLPAHNADSVLALCRALGGRGQRACPAGRGGA